MSTTCRRFLALGGGLTAFLGWPEPGSGGPIVQNGEVLVVRGDDEIMKTVNGTAALQSLPALARQVIAHAGDNFQALTVWMTFEDQTLPGEAYESTVKNEVTGLGMALVDQSGNYGSSGVLRSVLNMKAVGLRAGDVRQTWNGALATWGQESAHRWLMFFNVRNPLTGKVSDLLRGRDCAHYSRFVETQASVMDGLAWRDNGNGTFTWTESFKRYAYLDLYGMGVLAADEMPPFYFIADIPGYTQPSCTDYDKVRRPNNETVSGTRVALTVDDIIAATGERLPRAHDPNNPQDYWREVQVVLTKPQETPDSSTPRALAARINKARLWWEEWNRAATGNRVVICTQVSQDCGDPRSDVSGLKFNLAKVAPAAGPLALDVDVTNGGKTMATGVRAEIEVKVGDQILHQMQDVGALDPGATKTPSFPLDLHTVSCGTEISVKASTQSDFHHHRRLGAFLVGANAAYENGFEGDTAGDDGWVVNPDGDDSSMGARWERGQPELTQVFTTTIQPAGAHGGRRAWVTGAAAKATGASTFVEGGKTTLQSPALEAALLREPLLRYWVSFAGVRSTSNTTGIEPSPDSVLTVLARNTAPAAGDGDAGSPGSSWIEVDRLASQIAPDWALRTVALPAELWGRGSVQFRFVVADTNQVRGGVEAAIDDLEITSKLPGCYAANAGDGGATVGPTPPADGGGCGCRIGRRDAPARFAPTGVVLFALVVAAARLMPLPRRPRRL